MNGVWFRPGIHIKIREVNTGAASLAMAVRKNFGGVGV
jgi:hypothetical protein